MAEKLRSILRRISWSSVLKAVLFAVTWWALPFWLFFLVALYLYFVPMTGAHKVSVPFFVLLLITLLQRPGIIFAVIFGVVFYFLLLVKDLIIIDRRFAYEVLMLVLSYLLLRGFFLNVGGSFGWWSLTDSAVAAAAVSVLVTSFIKNFSAAPQDLAREARSFRRMLGWMMFLLTWQLLIVGLFLPLDFLYQSAIIFLVAVIILDLVPQYVFGELTRRKVLATGTVLFALLVIVLSSARWII
ncbi:MAG: hypothetical protein ABR884_02615 [Minisyncoccia bacterium]|jgi:hypothetical protein